MGMTFHGARAAEIFRTMQSFPKSLLFSLWVLPVFVSSLVPLSAEEEVDPEGSGLSETVLFLPRAEPPPDIDGAWSDFWEENLLSESFLQGGMAPPNKTVAAAAYDDEYLYLAAVAWFPSREDLLVRAGPDDPTRSVWQDDCLDFRISPDEGMRNFQLLINARGTVLSLRNARSDWHPEGLKAEARLEDDRYVVMMAVPLKEIGLEGALIPSLRLNAGRADRSEDRVQLSTAFGESFGNVTESPTIVLGDEEEWVALTEARGFSRQLFGFHLYLDREVYPVFDRKPTGRVVARTPAGGKRFEGEARLRLTLLEGEEVVFEKGFENVEDPRTDFDLDLSEVAPGQYQLRAVLMDGEEELASTGQPVRIVEAEAQREGSVTLRIPPGRAEAPAWPMTFGVPFPWGALDATENLRILDADGGEIPFQARPTGRWSRNGTLRWVLIDLLAPVKADEQILTLEYGPGLRREDPAQGVQVEVTEEVIQIDTGAVRFEIPTENSPGIGRLWLRNEDGKQLLMEAGELSGPVMVNAEGVEFLGGRDGVAEVEESGPIRAVVKVEGYHRDAEGQHLGRFITRYTAWAGLPWVQLDHTFIFTHDAEEAQYRNIAHRLPMEAAQYVFGLAEGKVHQGEVGEESVYLLQRDDVQFILRDGERRVEDGRLPGWFAAGGSEGWMTVALRDFWQKFPYEVEVESDLVNFHFWPRHGEAPLRPAGEVPVEEVHHLWFAHEGEVLDLRVPEPILELFAQDTLEEDVENARLANPTGAAVTQHILMAFHPEPWGVEQSAAFNSLFQQEPSVISDPSWVTESGVFGWLLARDRERFPEVEKAQDLSFDLIRRYQELDRDYGMFNFGDSHHNWRFAEERWNLHRIWYNNHHGWNRWPWIQFARSGDAEILEWARQNSRFGADMVHANYAPERFQQAAPPRQKILGGITDYKGLVHWSRGDRLGYNSSADALFWHYYFTGDRRSLSTALNHCQALLNDPTVRGGRGGSGRVTSAIAGYWVTWDNDYLEFFERHMRPWLDNPPAHPQNLVFAPSIERYVELTENSRAKQMIIDWAEFVIDDYPASTSYWYDLHRRTLLSYAYLFSGDERFLRAAAKRVRLVSDFLYLDEDDPRYHGLMVMGPGNLYRSYFLQQAPYYLYAAARHSGEPEPWPSSRVMIRSLIEEKLEEQERYVFRVRLRAGEEGPTEVEALLRGARGAGGVRDTFRQTFGGWITTPDGERLDGEVLDMAGQGRPIRWEFEAVAGGEYEMVLWSENNFYIFTPITSGDSQWKEIYRMEPGLQLGDSHQYTFAMPTGSEGAEFAYRGRGRPTAFLVYSPDGEMVAEDLFLAHRLRGDRTLIVERGEWPREGWGFKILGYGGGQLRSAEFIPDPELPFYFSTTREKWFEPHQQAPGSR